MFGRLRYKVEGHLLPWDNAIAARASHLRSSQILAVLVDQIRLPQNRLRVSHGLSLMPRNNHRHVTLSLASHLTRRTCRDRTVSQLPLCAAYFP